MYGLQRLTGLASGDMVVDLGKRTVKQNHLYAIRTDDALQVKRLRLGNGGFVVISDHIFGTSAGNGS